MTLVPFQNSRVDNSQWAQASHFSLLLPSLPLQIFDGISMGAAPQAQSGSRQQTCPSWAWPQRRNQRERASSVPDPLKPATARTPIPAKTDSPGVSIFDFMRQQRIAQRAGSSQVAKASRRIALGQEQEYRARKHIVDGTGNA